MAESLSLSSNIGFTHKGKWYPNVIQFALAMQFAGTETAERIRVAPTIRIAEYIAKGRHVVAPFVHEQKILFRGGGAPDPGMTYETATQVGLLARFVDNPWLVSEALSLGVSFGDERVDSLLNILRASEAPGS